MESNSFSLPDDEKRVLQRGTLAILFKSLRADKGIWDPSLAHDVSECLWDGVLCLDGRTVSLDLFGNGLWGSIPVEISFLNKLTSLDMSENGGQDDGIGGTIPTEMGSFTDLGTCLSYMRLCHTVAFLGSTIFDARLVCISPFQCFWICTAMSSRVLFRQKRDTCLS